MNMEQVKTKFARMGVRFKVDAYLPRRWERTTLPFRLDVQKDRKGETFVFQVRPGADLEVEVPDVQARQRHLLLAIRASGERQSDRFLCGHDERSWFVAAVPGGGTVKQAFEALKPPEVRSAQEHAELKTGDRNRRRNAAFVRQGEWFFLPEPQLQVNDWLILRNEPLRRGAGKPHMAEQLVRTGGQRVYVSTQHPNGLSEDQYRNLLAGNDKAGKWNWRVMVRDAGVYVRGRIRHPDHKTIVLDGWHQVLPNTETQTRAMANVAFLD